MKEFGYPAPLQDVTRAIRTVRAEATERGIDPERIGVIGFSAGGHVAGLAATRWHAPESHNGDALDDVSARPDFAVLIYPVATMREPFSHLGSRRNLFGPEPSEEAIQTGSLESQVTAATPPMFLVHTATDRAVPAENSLLLASALRAHEIPVELHLFAEGPHGFGMRPGYGSASTWPTHLAAWLQTILPPKE